MAGYIGSRTNNALVSLSGASGTVSDDVVFPSGHIIQQDSKLWHWSGDNGTGSSGYPTIATYGPVISMQLKNANAKVGYSIYMSRAMNTSSVYGSYYLMGSTTSFAASGYSTSHGASVIPPVGKTADGSASITGNEIGNHANSHHLAVTLIGVCQCSNTANQTMYFSAGALCSGDSLYYNYDGVGGHMTFTLSEIQV